MRNQTTPSTREQLSRNSGWRPRRFFIGLAVVAALNAAGTLRAQLGQMDAGQRQAWQSLSENTGQAAKLHLSPRTGTPRQIAGGILQTAVAGRSGEVDAARTARAFLGANRALLGLQDPDVELTLLSTRRGTLNRQHLRFKQSYQGVEVWPSDLVIHLDPQGNVDLMDGAYVRTPDGVAVDPLVAQDEAVAAAVDEFGPGQVKSGPDLILYTGLQSDTTPRLAWRMELHASLSEHWLVVIDARDGQVLTAHNEVCTGRVNGSGVDVWGRTRSLSVWEAEGTYYLVDTSKTMFDPSSTPPERATTRGGIHILDAANQEPDAEGNIPVAMVSSTSPDSWAVPAAVSAAFGLSETYDYYLDRHQRNSLDGNGGNIVAIVRYGRDYRNAFWNGELMVFGDGQNYAGSIDTVGHELTHGVTENTSDLLYRDQPGALNEALSDIFGELVEARTAGRPDWLKGAELGGAPIQNYMDPHAAEQLPGVPNPATMSEFVATEEDNGGVHINSSIINHCFYLLAEGMNGAIGIRDAEAIFYRAATVHLVQNSQFVDCRLACVQAATEIFGAGSSQAQTTAAAFDAVEIFADGTPPPGGPGTPPADGQDDAFEENDDPQQAKPIPAGSHALQGNDDDWFQVNLNQPGAVAVRISGPQGDLDLYVFDSQGNELGYSEEYGSEEYVEALTEDGTLFVAVSPYEGGTSAYTLTIEGPGGETPGPMPGPTPAPGPDSDGGPDDGGIVIPVTCGIGSPMAMIGAMFGLIGLGAGGRRRRTRSR
ncbi:MAG: M4 family metallopeptidase [Phycisphaerae bacterium]